MVADAGAEFAHAVARFEIYCTGIGTTVIGFSRRLIRQPRFESRQRTTPRQEAEHRGGFGDVCLECRNILQVIHICHWGSKQRLSRHPQR
eukprot:1204945-Prymnesium_polylepis.1